MNNTDIIFMTTAISKPEKQEQVYQALCDVAEAARAQTGCIDYRIFRSSDNATTTVNFEQWSSEQARDAFLAGPDVQKFAAAVSGAFAESPQPTLYQQVG